jgi:hypothetical protein
MRRRGGIEVVVVETQTRQVCVYYCSTYYKAVREGGGGKLRTCAVCLCVCVFITTGPSTKLFAWGWGGYGRTCATRDDESVCVFITAVPITKLFA